MEARKESQTAEKLKGCFVFCADSSENRFIGSGEIKRYARGNQDVGCGVDGDNDDEDEDED